MKLKALDQISISSVQADSLRPGQQFVVSDALGNDLLKRLAGRVALVSASSVEDMDRSELIDHIVSKVREEAENRDDDELRDAVRRSRGPENDESETSGELSGNEGANVETSSEPSGEKAETTPSNKAEAAAPANKADNRRTSK